MCYTDLLLVKVFQICKTGFSQRKCVSNLPKVVGSIQVLLIPWKTDKLKILKGFWSIQIHHEILDENISNLCIDVHASLLHNKCFSIRDFSVLILNVMFSLMFNCLTFDCLYRNHEYGWSNSRWVVHRLV